MAKYGGTLSAATELQVAGASADRLSICIINLSSADSIKVEFGQAASTATPDGSWHVFPQSQLTLVQGEFPEITMSINLISTGTPSYIVRTTE